MDQMSISEFKATCLKVIERVRRSGRALLITKNGEPAALVSAPPKQINLKEPLFGRLKGDAKIVGDIVSPLNDVEWDVLK